MSCPLHLKSAVALASILLIVSWGAQSAPQATTVPAEAPRGLAPLEQLRADATALVPLVESKLARQFLKAVENLPSPVLRSIFRDRTTRAWYSAEQAGRLPDEHRHALEVRTVDDALYYNTKYGSPLAYCRPVDLLGTQGINNFAGMTILDFGYGTIGHLRLMASCGAHVTGLDVDPFLTALYSHADDQGTIRNTTGEPGSITLVNGRFSEDAVRTSVGDQYDLIISKNTLKRGYIHPPPEENVDKRLLVDLGLNDEAFVQTLFDLLKPGGMVMIYNLSPKPAPPGEKYIPWADGRCPFEKPLLEHIGFKVVTFDEDDGEAARKMGRALGWDQGDSAMDLEKDLFAHFTLLQKPGA